MMKEIDKKYNIVAVFWEDHIKINRSELPADPDSLFESPVLSVGILYEETDKSLTIVSDVEKMPDGSIDATYMVILKNTIIGRKIFGEVELSL